MLSFSIESPDSLVVGIYNRGIQTRAAGQPGIDFIGLMVPQDIAQTSTVAMVLSVNRAKKATKALENIYCCVWYVSIGSDSGPECMRIGLAYLLIFAYLE